MDSLEEVIKQLQADLAAAQGATGSFASTTQLFIDSLRRGQRNLGYYDRYIRTASDATEDFADYIDRSSDSADVFSGVLRESSRQEQSRLRKMSDAAKGFVDSTLSNISRLGEGSSESSNTLTNAAELGAKAITFAMDGIKGIAGAIAPGIGSAIVGMFTTTIDVLATAGSALVGFYAGQMEGLRNQQKQFFASGVQFSGGIDDAMTIIQSKAKDNTLTMGNLSAAAEMAQDSLRLMSGGAGEALKRLGKTFQTFNKEQLNDLYTLGYTNEEILSGMADYAADAERYGQQLSNEELAIQSQAYLKNLKELERLTGVDAKTRKAQAQKLREETAIQFALMKKIPVEQRRQVLDTLAVVEETFPGMAKQVAAKIAGVQLADPTAAITNTYAPNLVKALVDAVQSGDVDKANKILSDRTGVVGTEINTLIDRFGELSFNADKLPGSFADFLTGLGSAKAKIDGLTEAAGSAGVKLGEQGSVQQGVNDFVFISGQMTNQLQSMAFTVTEYVAPAMSALVSGLNVLINKLNSTVESTTLYGSAVENAKRLSKEGQQTLGLSEDNPGSFNFKVTEDLQKEADKKRITVHELMRQKVDELLKKEIENQQKLQDNAIRTIINAYDGLRPISDEEIEKATNQIEKDKLLERRRIYDIIDDLDESGLKKYNLESDGVGWDWQDKETFKLKQNYRGAVVPKNPPGGRIMSLAERDDEAIMPLARVSGGDLGVKVSGQLIDGSVLMKNLLDVNKGQATLMAGLSSQIANLNSTFEKLVYEQRQANRLAV